MSAPAQPQTEKPAKKTTAKKATPAKAIPAATPAPPESAEGDLLVLIPSKGRPEAVDRMLAAIGSTSNTNLIRLVWVLDELDPCLPAYQEELHADGLVVGDGWTGMAPQTNEAARRALERYPDTFAIAVLNDDHLPRTPGWAQAMLAALREMGTGIVYGDDLLRGEALPTAWAMTTDIVREIGRVIPALVQHQYADNSVLDLGRAAGCIRYLPDVVIEHMHPLAGKGDSDEGYARVNAKELKAADRKVYERWRDRPITARAAGLASQTAKVRALMV